MVREFPVYQSQQDVAGYNLSASAGGGLHGGVSAFMKAGPNDGITVEGFNSYVAGAFVCQKTQHNHPFGVFYGENPLSYSFPLVLLEISFVLLATRLVRFVLKPLRQPRIVSEILVSLLIIIPLMFRTYKLYIVNYIPSYLDYFFLFFILV